MADAALVVTVAVALLAGVGSYLYNDGRDHSVVGLIALGLSGVGFLLSGVAGAQSAAEQQVDAWKAAHAEAKSETKESE